MIYQSGKRVFADWRYALLALLSSLLIILISVWLPNKSLLGYIFSASNLSWVEKFAFLLGSFGILGSNFSFFSRSVIIILALLSGINLAFLVYFLKSRIKSAAANGLGFLGIISGLVGIGCASCGSVILSSIFGFTAASGWLGFLPWQGVEFAVFGLALLLFSIFLLAKKIQNPLVCKIK